MTRGSLVVVSGFSGVGKGTVMKSLMERHKGYALSISATTRKPREGEKDGREYFFLQEEAFQDLIDTDGLIEHACYCGHYYGTPRFFVEKQLAAGVDVILEIEIQGARSVKTRYPDALLIFIMPPSARELQKRLTGRGTETAQAVCQRLLRAADEAAGIEEYDYLFVNDEADLCADRIHELIQAQRHLTSRNETFIQEIRAQIQDLSKGD